jgi:DnaA family protein
LNQLVLPLRLDDYAVFDTFHSAGNETIVDYLCSMATSDTTHGAWLWGAAATGKSHLLQAACESFGDRAAYLPLREFSGATPELLEGLGSRDLVCIDDLHLVVGDSEWEQALFGLCNEVFDAGHQLAVSATVSPRNIGIGLPDLRSRLQRLPSFQLRVLDDGQRIAALQLRARHRGLDLPDDTARYMLSRSKRDMRSLYQLLDKLDLEALRAQRRMTIPFVKSVLGL